jgi:hypothetical protein
LTALIEANRHWEAAAARDRNSGIAEINDVRLAAVDRAILVEIERVTVGGGAQYLNDRVLTRRRRASLYRVEPRALEKVLELPRRILALNVALRVGE